MYVIPLVVLAAIFATSVGSIISLQDDTINLVLSSIQAIEDTSKKNSELLEIDINQDTLLIKNPTFNNITLVEIYLSEDAEGTVVISRRVFQDGASRNNTNVSFMPVNSGIIPSGMTREFEINHLGDTYGYVVTSSGNKFRINGKEGTTSLGTSFTIQSISEEGSVIFGRVGASGIENTVRPFVGVPIGTNFAHLIKEASARIQIQEYGSEYVYESSLKQLLKTGWSDRNVLGYDDTLVINGAGNIITSNQEITFSGDGVIITKLNNESRDLLIVGNLKNGTIRLAESVYDITTLPYDESNGFLIDVSNPKLTFSQTRKHYGKCCTNSWYEYNMVLVIQVGKKFSNMNNIRIVEDLDRVCKSWINHYRCNVPFNPSFTLNGEYGDGYYTLNSVSVRWTEVRNGLNPYQYKIVGSASFYDDLPINTRYESSTNFSIPYTLSGNSINYIIAEPNGNTIQIHSRSISKSALLHISNLPEHIPYRLVNQGIVINRGLTDGNGEISLDHTQITLHADNVGYSMLELFEDPFGYVGDFNTILLDVVNQGTTRLESDSMIIIPHVYLTLSFPVETSISGVMIGDVRLPYLDKTYDAADSIWIPIVPNGKIASMRIEGTDVKIQVSSIPTSNSLVPIYHESSTISTRANHGVVEVTSDVTSEAIHIAKRDGMILAVVEAQVSGEAEFTLDGTYVGDVYTKTYCKIYQTSDKSRVCKTHSYPISYSSYSELERIVIEGKDTIGIVKELESQNIESLRVYVDVFVNGVYNDTHTLLVISKPLISINSKFKDQYNIEKSARLIFQPEQVKKTIFYQAKQGDMIEFSLRVNLPVKGFPIPITSKDTTLTSIASATTTIHDGTILTGFK